ncbi:hypothetical protein Lesp02_72900 [Lentzea sp. NBRC 105346]|uniref:hypothetical protein n=1 Tax=Lentzea sp. NBRC 105346 TaxID=3032205 RepID=UPI0024A04AFF|nr:hypothetical protein [Lentzea sp. NBRC 105346]GLZ35103.1 hypothetical protein Lesp02_72900 [Lentzea sp. NBRC 105346]
MESEPANESVANTAGPGTTVGIQASCVHNSTVYQVLQDASPEEKYKVGLRFLADGVPLRARDLITEAIASGFDNGEVRFHQMLALLSKRSLRDLNPAERHQLEHVAELAHDQADDGWKDALLAMCELLNRLQDSDRNCGSALERLHALPSPQRNEIVRHLDLVITGGMKDTLWAETRQRAEAARFANDRQNRVWAYFHPAPIGPKARPPVDVRTVPGDWAVATGCSVLVVLAFGYLCRVVWPGGPVPLLACAFVVISGYVAAQAGFEWCYRSERMALKERDHAGRRRRPRALNTKFASRVDQSFTYYFGKYVPEGVNREQWLTDTAGIRVTLRDEVVELYQDSKISVDRVNWLIRHLVGDVRKRWERGTLLEHRESYRTGRATKVRFTVAVLVLALASLGVAATAVLATEVILDRIFSVAAMIVTVVAARAAIRRWFRIVSEGRRFIEDQREYDRQMAARRDAYAKWKKKLEDTRPSEREMEAWLHCDKTMLLEAALRHYGLVWREVITHAFLQAPAKNYKRARVEKGPWRYSKYDIRLFLITQDGVREVSSELDFARVEQTSQERSNYRFDAVSSVQVVEEGAASCTLELTLFNGPSRSIRVVEPETGRLEGESPAALSETSLDSAGFAHTLHILEGIAAEGKSWIDHDIRGGAEPAKSVGVSTTLASRIAPEPRPH